MEELGAPEGKNRVRSPAQRECVVWATGTRVATITLCSPTFTATGVGGSGGFAFAGKTVVQPSKKCTSYRSIQCGIGGSNSGIAKLWSRLIAGVDGCRHLQKLPAVPWLEDIDNSGDENCSAPE